MRKTFLVLLAFLMLASACSGDASDESSTTDTDNSTAADTATTAPSVDTPATVDDPVVLLPVFRPAYDPAGDPAVYLHGLAVWVLETEDGFTARTDPGDRTAASRRASECYASAFVSVLDPERHAEVAAELSRQGLLNGFPLGVVTDAERERLHILATPCLDAAWQANAASKFPQDFLGDDIEFTEEQNASLTAAAEECLETLTADDNSREWILASALFDSPAAEQQLGVAVLSACSDTVMTPILTEQFMLEGFERGTAECVASRMVELMATAPELFEAAEHDPEANAAIRAEMSAIMSGCGVTDSFFPQ